MSGVRRCLYTAGFIGIIIFAGIAENFFPDTRLKKAYMLMLSAYILISILSFVGDVDFSFPSLGEESVSFGDYHGEDVAISYFKNNIKSVIKERWGIDESKTEVEVSISENRELKIKKITVSGTEKADFKEMEKVFGAALEVI